MTWIFRGEAKLTWQCLEECKNFLFASSFNLYTSRRPARCAKKKKKKKKKKLI
jgi:hypothetical protein